MEAALSAKFKDNYNLQQRLLKTGDRTLVEANTYDALWGIGLGLRDPATPDATKWKGQNLLGTLLESVRDEIKAW